jgi:hypothetical protein
VRAGRHRVRRARRHARRARRPEWRRRRHHRQRHRVPHDRRHEGHGREARRARKRQADYQQARLQPPLLRRRKGICVDADGTGARYRALILDDNLKVLHTVPLNGLPSRARVSDDGRYGATTNFVSGHSYTFGGGFSTETAIIDLGTGRRLFNLEQLKLYDEQGKRIDRPDINLWGVSFDPRDSNRFFATLRSSGVTHLIAGDIAKRTAHALRTNVECPSLSPDATRIAYKKVIGAKQDRWRLYVLDLKTMKDHALAEPQQVDDQVEWRDDRTVLYERDYDVYALPADGSGAPRKLITRAESPSVVR